MHFTIIVFLFLPFFCSCTSAAAPRSTKKTEKFYQNKWCAERSGQTEVRLDDGTRVDCLTNEFAIEVEFAHKWAESVGQSLYYSIKTGKQPGVLLILESPEDKRFLTRLQIVATKNNITIWPITAE